MVTSSRRAMLAETSAAKAVRKAKLRRIRRRIRELRMESLQTYVPLPAAEAFHASIKPIDIIDGSNQAGKSLALLMELILAISGCHPVEGKYPKKNGRAIVVGYDERHIADPLWYKLTREGEYKLIPDENTGRIRAVRPDPNNPRSLDPYDLAYREKWVDAPPLLPPRLIKGQPAWGKKAQGVVRSIETTTGWVIGFLSSKASPPQGIQLHLAALDEELDRSHVWVNELAPRMAKEHGKMIWGATPLTGGIPLWQLREKAANGHPHVNRTTLLIDDNPYITAEAKQIFFETLTDEEERAVRYYGEYRIVGRLVYGTYDPMGIHGCEPFELPPEWCRFCVLDPGTQKLACLLGAVDPEEEHDWIYDGFQMSKPDAMSWACEVRRRGRGVPFQAYVIDQQMGKQRPPGFGITVAEQYFAALEEIGMEPAQRGPLAGFFPGSNDIPAREQSVRSLMQIRGTGRHPNTPTLQVFRDIIPELNSQIKHAQTKQGTLNKREKQSDEGLVQCLEYFAAFGPRYYPPVETTPVVLSDTQVDETEREFRRLARRRGRSPNRFGSFLEIG